MFKDDRYLNMLLDGEKEHVEKRRTKIHIRVLIPSACQDRHPEIETAKIKE